MEYSGDRSGRDRDQHVFRDLAPKEITMDHNRISLDRAPEEDNKRDEVQCSSVEYSDEEEYEEEVEEEEESSTDFPFAFVFKNQVFPLNKQYSSQITTFLFFKYILMGFWGSPILASGK